MARKTDIEQSEIDLICKTLEGDGFKATVDRVRAEVGKGSRTTINRMIRVYESNRDTINPEVEVTAETDMILRRLHTAISQEYIGKIKEYQKEIEELKGKMDHYLNESQKYLEEINMLKLIHTKLSEDQKVERERADDAIKRMKTIDEENYKLRDIESAYKILLDQNKELKKSQEKDKKQIESLIQRATVAETKLELLKK
ncbi:DNA-binding protein [Thiospirochaeta perfilievii]|nr:DNA-binding protein [Thiospirochaeta perfilievii]